MYYLEKSIGVINFYDDIISSQHLKLIINNMRLQNIETNIFYLKLRTV